MDHLNKTIIETVADWVSILNFFAILAAIVAVWFARETLEEQRVATAWSLVVAVKSEGAGNVGLIDALETLARRGRRLDQVKLPGAYLSGVDLRSAHLGGVDLHDATLAGANLSTIDLSGADLSRANLRDADLRDADLRGANLDQSDLSGAKLQGADLRGANLHKAQLFRADLRWARLDLANLSEANLSVSRLNNAQLRGATFDRTIMRSADLTHAEFHRAIILSPIDLRRARLLGACLNKAVPVTSDLDEAYDVKNACSDDKTEMPEKAKKNADGVRGWCGPPVEQWDPLRELLIVDRFDTPRHERLGCE